jgi:hypothetical protein
VVLADEPTGNLDEDTRDDIIGLLERLWRERNLTLVLVTHDTYRPPGPAGRRHEQRLPDHQPGAGWKPGGLNGAAGNTASGPDSRGLVCMPADGDLRRRAAADMLPTDGKQDVCGSAAAKCRNRITVDVSYGRPDLAAARPDRHAAILAA